MSATRATFPRAMAVRHCAPRPPGARGRGGSPGADAAYATGRPLTVERWLRAGGQTL